ncbi:uncharacterized protein LOC126265729 [Aethina tumida]|uniref:uncharacterized protein LOC126265729 n=1 Tax=Aethina tumida TaxID=116153 RepID=UPI0021497FF6|nr:uncharacterized protein LOC126265729 [Aethina tumida]XP_049824142.1 uncharacterized protein LOC126265729 [Aethina tumida]XP_049824143.1 uncharacterized protein LOC126265729 [Aethina tumida]XP_049824144.1 uncharacterized protein LOC126265729 [Aethina tumida]
MEDCESSRIAELTGPDLKNIAGLAGETEKIAYLTRATTIMEVKRGEQYISAMPQVEVRKGWFEALRDLAPAVVCSERQSIVKIPTKGNKWGILRKATEYICGEKNIRATIYVSQKRSIEMVTTNAEEGEPLRNLGKTTKIHKTYALVVQKKDADYEETLKAVKSSLSTTEGRKAVQTMRSTRHGRLLITMEKNDRKARRGGNQSHQCRTGGRPERQIQEWGSRVEDRRGPMLAEWLAMHDLMVQNRGCVPTYVHVDRNLVIDVTASSGDLADTNRQWRVKGEKSLSFHRYVIFDVMNGRQETPRSTKGWNVRQLNQVLLRECVEKDLGDKTLTHGQLIQLV